ncbi:MAG: hypothetical protein LW809_03295 [Vampirovibrionales bacterium]|jgi:hypothetical protein|nr:hypothetical protein [Vampirovibrionales bacterium]
MSLLGSVFGGLGNRKRSKDALNALKPIDFTSPFGSLTGGGNYKPVITKNQQNVLDQSDDNLFASLKATAPTRNATESWNQRVMPLADTMYSNFQRNASRNFSTGQRDLNNRMNAYGQTGNAYDALQQSQFRRNYDDSLNDAYTQSQASAYDAYMEWYKQQLAAQQSFGNTRDNLREALMRPMAYFTNHQQALSGLQQQRADLLGRQQNGWDFAKSFDDLATQAILASAGVPSGGGSNQAIMSAMSQAGHQ